MEDMQAVSRRRMMDLERRVFALEERMRRALWSDEWMRTHSARENALVEQYGEAVDKTLAARILGVTRATVYAMLADGRITGACEGRRVDVRSIARYLSSPDEEAGKPACRQGESGRNGGKGHECA